LRWFVGLSIDAPPWDIKVVAKNRKQLLASNVSRSLKPWKGAADPPRPDCDGDLYGRNGEKMPYHPARARPIVSQDGLGSLL